MTSSRPWFTFLLTATALIAACCSLISFQTSSNDALSFHGHFESGTGAYFFVQARQRPDKVPGEDPHEMKLDDDALIEEDLKKAAPPAPRELGPELQGEKFEFKAEMAALLQMVINNLYTDAQIAVRELISNASDALLKLRYSLLKAGSAVDNDKLRIEITPDKEKRTLTFRDYGIGMSKDELVNNLGTLAKSGTKEFMAALKANPQGDNATLSDAIGKFGVGFYSSYLIADKVTVRSKKHGEKEAYVWESMADASFVVAKDTSEKPIEQGTEITLFLKSDKDEFLQENTLKDHIRHHNGFIDAPIMLWTEKEEKEEVPVEEEEKEKDAEKSEDEEDVEEVDEKEDDKPKTKTVTKVVHTWEHLNPVKLIWRRDPREVSPENYTSFYHVLMENWKLKDTHKADPLAYSHFRSEGQLQFSTLLYIPGEAATNALQSMQDTLQNISLYIKRVFITKDFEDMFPRWLSFVKGVLDSDDLPLNVNREQLQQTQVLRSIKRKMISKSLDMIRDLSKDEEKYPKFLKAFGMNLKLGVLEDQTYKDKIVKLLRFYSSSSHGVMNVTLDDYLERMKKKQSGIFFLSGSSLAEVQKSVFLEKPLARGYEVLYMVESIDAYLMQSLTEYEGKQFKDIAKDGVKYGDEDKDEKSDLKAKRKEYKPLTKWMLSVLDKFVDKVSISVQLVQSPAAIKAKAFGWSAATEKIMNSQALSGQEDFMRDFYSKQKKVMEINPEHPLIQKMLQTVKEEDLSEEKSGQLNETAQTLYDAALISSGYEIADVAGFSSRLEKIMRRALSVSETAKAKVNVRKAEDKVEGEEDEPSEPEEPESDDDDEDEDENNKKMKFSDKTMPDMDDMADLPDLPDFGANDDSKESDKEQEEEELDHDEL